MQEKTAVQDSYIRQDLVKCLMASLCHNATRVEEEVLRHVLM